MAFPVINPILQFFDNSGNVLSGGKLFVYEPGTTTKKNTHSDENLSVLNANPIVLDSAGRCTIFLADGAEYKFVLAPATDTDPPTSAIRTIDEVKSPSALTAANIGAGLYPRTAAEISAAVTPVDYSYHPEIVVRQGTTGDGVADDTAEIQAAISAAIQLGARLYFPEGTYGISSTLTVTGKIYMEMAPGAQIKALAAFPNPASVDDASWMIDASGAGIAGSRFVRINLHGNEVAKGFRAMDSTDVQVVHGSAKKMRGPGFYFDDMTHSVAAFNFMDECGVDSGGSTGVYTTSLRCQGNGVTCEQILFHGNIINNSGGKGIAFSTSTRCIASDNFVKDCVAGHGACFYVAASSHIVFRGNLGYGSVTGSAEIIKFSTTANYCTAESNYFIQTIDQDICVIEDASFLTIQGNTFIKVNAPSASEQAIKLNDSTTNSTNLLIKNNAFYGHDVSVGTAIAAPSTVANVTIIGNHFENWSTGVQVVGSAPILRTNSYRSVTTPEQLAGASSPTADYAALILRTVSDQSATGPGAGTLSLTLPAARMDRTRGIRVKGSGTKAGGAGNKTIAFRFGTTDFEFNAAANDTNSWYFEAEVLNVSETSQRVHGVGFNGATALPFIGTAAEDTGTALSVGVRATPAGADTVTLKMLTIELLP